MDNPIGVEGPSIVAPPPGPRSRAIAAREAKVGCPAFDERRAVRAAASDADQSPIVYARGLGSNVWDADGNRYVDLVAGFGALVLGHAPSRVVAAARAEEDRLGLALGDVYASEAKVALEERLAALFPEPNARVLLGLSGADATTAALKTAVLATGASGVIAFRGGYHGLSYAPLAACGLAPSFREPFAEQIGDHVAFVDYPGEGADPDAAARAIAAIAKARPIGAVLVEPILGRGGCVVPPPGFLASLRRACDAEGALLIVDEIWTGMGRSGGILASTAECLPDLVLLGKGLGAGYPISACVGRASAMASWGARGGGAIHTATHFGAPPSCAAALASLEAIVSDDLAPRASTVGAAFLDELRRALEGKDAKVRGRGLMIGVDLGSSARALRAARALLSRGYLVLTGGSDGATLTLTPPLVIPEALLTGFSVALAEVVAAL